MKSMNNFLDNEGLLVQQCGITSNYKEGYFNPIDSMFLTCNTIVFKEFLGELDWYANIPLDALRMQAWVSYRVPYNNGLNRRYWRENDTTEGRYWKNPSTLSRDNHIGYIMAFKGNDARNVAREIIKRGSFFQNVITNKGEAKLLPDLCGVSQWSIILRCLGIKNKSVLAALLFTDLFYLLAIIFAVIKSHVKPKHCSTIYHELAGVVTTSTIRPTFLSRIAKWFYINKHKGIVEGLKYYSRTDYDPPIYIIAEEVVKKLQVRI